MILPLLELQEGILVRSIYHATRNKPFSSKSFQCVIYENGDLVESRRPVVVACHE